MDMSIIVSIIGNVLTAICTIVSVLVSNSKSRAITDYKIEALREEIEKINGLDQRMYRAESKLAVLEEKTKDI